MAQIGRDGTLAPGWDLAFPDDLPNGAATPMASSALRPASTTLAVLVALAGTAAAQEAVPQVRTQAPGYYRMMLGDYEITTVSDGTLSLDFARIMTNTTPEEVRALFARSREPLPVDVSINTFLINTGSKL